MNKSRKIAAIVFTILAAGMVVMSGIMKLMGFEQIVTGMTNVGVGSYINLLGMMEIAFAVVFVYPKTMKIGLLLLSCYFAGAIATELSHGGPIANPIMPLVLVWISAFLRDSSTFLPTLRKS